MTPLLRLRDAAYAARGRTIVEPATFDVQPGERVARVCANGEEARALAMMCAALVRATSGSLLIGEYDPRVQPVHCKRLVGFVAHDPLPLARENLERFVEYRAALWEIEPARAHAHVRLLLERLAGVHEAFAYPVAVALLPFPSLLVLDRPHPAFAPHVIAAAGSCAILSTHANEGSLA
ncbi:MAG: hypothetical protein KGN02_05215 [bacterium]|nr:hypothetical protein [bacterium]